MMEEASKCLTLRQAFGKCFTGNDQRYDLVILSEAKNPLTFLKIIFRGERACPESCKG